MPAAKSGAMSSNRRSATSKPEPAAVAYHGRRRDELQLGVGGDQCIAAQPHQAINRARLVHHDISLRVADLVERVPVAVDRALRRLPYAPQDPVVGKLVHGTIRAD